MVQQGPARLDDPQAAWEGSSPVPDPEVRLQSPVGNSLPAMSLAGLGPL